MRRLHNNPITLETDREGLEKQIRLLRGEAEASLGAASTAADHWVAKGEYGLGKFNRSVQKFGAKFADFVKVYAGIIDVIRQAGGVYGEVAYSTLSLFLFVRSDEKLRASPAYLSFRSSSASLILKAKWQQHWKSYKRHFLGSTSPKKFIPRPA